MQALPDNSMTVAQDSDGHALFTADNYRGQPGDPKLPVNNIQLLLPPDTEPTSVTASLEQVKTVAIPGIWEVDPVSPISSLGEKVWPAGANIIDDRNVETYASDRYLPGSFLGHVLSSQRHGWKIATIEYYPFQYNPVRHALLKIISAQVIVSFTRNADLNVCRTPLWAHTEKMREDIKQAVANFDEFSAGYDALQSHQTTQAPLVAPTQSASEQVTYATQEKQEYDRNAAPGYLIITTNLVVDNSQQLTDFVNEYGQLWFFRLCHH